MDLLAHGDQDILHAVLGPERPEDLQLAAKAGASLAFQNSSSGCLAQPKWSLTSSPDVL